MRLPSYISTRGKRPGWRYTFHIPADLRPFFGKNKNGEPLRAIVKYIAPMKPKEAQAQARKWAVEDQAWIETVRNWPADKLAQLAAAGGVFTLLKGDAPTSQLDPNYKGNEQLYLQRLHAEGVRLQVEAKIAKPPEIVTSFDRLFEEWKRIQMPRRPRDFEKTIRLLKEYFGERFDAATLTRSQVENWRDHLLAQKMTRGAVVSRLGHLKAMYAGAAKETSSPFHDVANPAAKVVLLGDKPVRKEKRSYTPDQVRLIFAKAKEVNFGKKKHDGVMWMLRLLLNTGARPNEIAQLQGGDVREEGGVKFIRIHETDAVKGGERHPQKSVKKGYARSVPLRAEVADFYDYVKAKGVAKDAFIFGSFTWSKFAGRAAYLITQFPKFLRDDCRIVSPDPNERYTLYSFRHTVMRKLRDARIPQSDINRLMGHKQNVSGQYGVADLKVLQKCVNRLKLT